MNTGEFIKRSKIHHNEFYDYSLSSYTKHTNKIKIICPKHGAFEQLPYHHMRGSGCSSCAIERRRMVFKKPLDDFLKEANYIHKGFYDYSEVEYVNLITKVRIICPKHGAFEQIPSNHLKGVQCPKCGHNSKSPQEYLDKIKKIHGNRYIYNNFYPRSAKDMINVTCRQHGDYICRLDVHLSGSNCPKCAKLSMVRKKNKASINCHSYSGWVQAAKMSDNFDSFKLYILKLESCDEVFIKIGKTFLPTEWRMKQIKQSCNNKYSITLIDEITKLSGEEVSILEHNILKKFLKYQPQILFEGKSECVAFEELENVLSFFV